MKKDEFRNKQIVITGCGVISALGQNKNENLARLFAGETGIKANTFSYKDGEAESSFGIIQSELKEHPFFKQHNLISDRATILALIAADECIEESGILNHEYDPLRVGVVIGTSLGGMRSTEIFHTQWIEKGIESTEAELLRQYPLHALVDVLAANYGFNGVKNVISTACSSGANAMGMAADLISAGICDVILTGGIDPISKFSFAGFTALGAIDAEQCTPYSTSRGINIGEGAACFILESAEFARKRDARILGEFRGYGISADAYHATAPDIAGNGAVRSMNAAMMNGECSLDELSYINGHGTGTSSNDSAEIKAWRSFVGDHKSIPLISNKASIGHCMGAAGAIELAFSLMSIKEKKIPPTINFKEEKTATEINFIKNHSVEADVKSVLSNSFAFGGNNCSVLLSEYKERQKKQTEEVDIVITGIGCTGTGGADIEELFETFANGTSWIDKIDTTGKDFVTEYVGRLTDIPYKKYIPSRVLRRIDKVAAMAMVSGKQALINANIKITPHNCTRIGVIYGTGTGPLETIEDISHKMIETGRGAVDASSFPNSVLNAAPGHFSIANMLKGPSSTISAGSVSSLNALIYAIELLKNNQADAIIVLSADEWNAALQVGNERLGLLTKNGKKAFSKDATGMILSQGSTAFVLERKDFAKNRGVNILGQIYGYSITSDNGPLCGFDRDGTQWSDGMKIAREMSGNNPIDYYASTAYGINIVDEKEEGLMKTALDSDTAVRSIPRLLGAASGSLGGYGLLSCIYAIINNLLPNQGQIDDELRPGFKEILDRDGKKAIECAAVSAASFGGTYTSLIIGKER